MTPSEKLNAILLVALAVAFAAGVAVGKMTDTPPPPTLPSNWDPLRADLTASLKACQETLALTIRSQRTEVSH